MLERQTRNNFQEHDWVNIIHEQSNPHQFVNRLKSRVDAALNDLALIARRLPDKEFEQIFDISNLAALLDALTVFEYSSKTKPVKRPHNYRILLLLMEKGLITLRDEDELQIGGIPNISKLLSDRLDETYGICLDIMNVIKRKETEKDAMKDGMIYLFKDATFRENPNDIIFSKLVLSSVDKSEWSKITKYPQYIEVSACRIDDNEVDKEFVVTADIIDTTTDRS